MFSKLEVTQICVSLMLYGRWSLGIPKLTFPTFDLSVLQSSHRPQVGTMTHFMYCRAVHKSMRANPWLAIWKSGNTELQQPNFHSSVVSRLILTSHLFCEVHRHLRIGGGCTSWHRALAAQCRGSSGGDCRCWWGSRLHWGAFSERVKSRTGVTCIREMANVKRHKINGDNLTVQRKKVKG